ncbi:MAG TPA: ATP-binding protein, partial [Solirubrobacteraceae bacterium]|nr:ATP-binding protein [Solirubrobacteraceae bacterium]
ATAAVSGGGASQVLYVLIAVPLAATLVMRPVELVGLAIAIVGGLVVVDPSGLPAWGVELIWVTAVGVVLSARREALLARVARLDALRAALLAADPDPERGERRRLATVLHESVLEPLGAVTEAAMGSVDGRGGMAGELDRIERSMRDVVAELHSPSGGRRDLAHGLRRLAERRAPRAEVMVTMAERPPEVLHEQLLTLARYLLEAVAGPRSRTVCVRVDAEGEAARLEVSTLEGTTALDGPVLDALRERVALLGAEVWLREDGLGLVAQLGPVEGVPALDARMPGRHEPLAVRAVSIARAGAAVAVVLVGGLVGGQQPGAWIAAALLVMTSPLVVWVLRSGRFGLKRYATVAVLDQALYLTGFALAGDTQAALVPLVVAVPPCYALLLAPGPTVLAAAAFGLGALAVADLSAGFAVAYVWAMMVAFLLAAGAAGASRLVNQLARRRQALQGRLLAEEEAARRRLAGELHDDALQLLLSARQDLVEAAEEGDRRSVWRAFEVLAMLATTLTRTLGELEEREAEPVAVGGLSSALSRVVAGSSEQVGPDVRLAVDEGAGGVHDGLIVRLVRELVLNARKHADASTIFVDVHRQAEELVIEVADDGVGWDRARVAGAAADGHIGLATASERVALAGGRLELVDAPAGGAAVRTVLPTG